MTITVVLISSSIHLIAQGQVQPAAHASLVSREAIRAVIAREPIRAQTAAQDPKPPADTRVRITAGPDVDRPGVFRITGKTMSGPVVSSDRDVVTVRTAGGQLVSLPRPGHKIIGAIVGVDERTVTVKRDRGSVITVPRSAIATLERSHGRRSRGRGMALGLLVGGAPGAGVGFLIGRSRKCPPFLGPAGAPATEPCFLEPQASTLAGLILAGGGGALIGALATPGDRWVAVPVDWLSSR